jgi:aspartyl-tRNA(Asn)/glutamyl-tRNA(Gln) amidotransferase subunit B
MGYKPTIGLEVHAELKTKSKMFCGCKNAPHGNEPNTLTCPVCLAHPGTLPVPNFAAIEHLLLFGRAVNANQATFTEFDRKSYFYPDIPKAYQISQYQYPFLSGGSLAGVELTRVHLEEDTARNQHEAGNSLVDFNRAGVPLMELVTEPVIHDAETAVTFAKELQLLLRTLGISDANMEKGEMRVEANISISDSEELGTKVEVKNLNSFKVVGQAIAYEIERHEAVLEEGGTLQQETRGWDEQKQKTFSQRSKETAKDYRYFPDPDIPKIDTTAEPAFSSTRLDEKLPKLPNEIREEYQNLGLTSEEVEQILASKSLQQVFAKLSASDELSDPKTFKLATNYMLSDVVAMADEAGKAVTELNIDQYVVLMSMLKAKEINSRVAKDILPVLITEGVDVRQYAEANDLLQVQDDGALEEIVDTVIAENPTVVADYKGGKETAIKFLVGQGMKLSKGTANPELLLEKLESKI